MKLSQQPSVLPRVFCASQCPPDNLSHEIDEFLIYYDLVYFPQCVDKKCGIYSCASAHAEKRWLIYVVVRLILTIRGLALARRYDTEWGCDS